MKDSLTATPPAVPASVPLPVPMPPAEALQHLRIFHINDVYELENMPHFKTLVSELSRGVERTMVVLAGDFLAPSLLSSLDKGRGMVDVMNECGVTHVCIGNHETDVGTNHLAARIRESKFAWINTNMRDLDSLLGVDTPSHVVVDVGRRKIAVIGVLTEDPSLYSPTSFGGARIEPVMSATERYLHRLLADDSFDMVLPLTHLRMPDDREFGKKFGGRSPIVLGGHDHDFHDETVDCDGSACRIIKTGQDAHLASVVDVYWTTSDGKPTVDVTFVPTKSYPADQAVQHRVEGHLRILQELENARLFRISDWMKKSKEWEGSFSTKNNRLGPSNGSRVLTAMIRMSMRTTCAIMNAGSIRGGRDYKDKEWFTWSDLKSELPFVTNMIAVPVPGRVLEATILYSRRFVYENDPPIASGAYLHCCDHIDWDYDTNTVRSIAGEPFDPDKEYLTALKCDFFIGIDDHVPLLEWAKTQSSWLTDQEHLQEAGREVKLLLVEMFSSLIWLELGSFDSVDRNNDGYITREEVRSRVVDVFGSSVSDIIVDTIFDVADLDQTGYITPLEMMVVQFVATDMLDHVCTQEELCVMRDVATEVLGDDLSREKLRQVVTDLKETLDASGDGRIDRSEAMQALGEVRRKSLL